MSYANDTVRPNPCFPEILSEILGPARQRGSRGPIHSETSGHWVSSEISWSTTLPKYRVHSLLEEGSIAYVRGWGEDPGKLDGVGDSVFPILCLMSLFPV